MTAPLVVALGVSAVLLRTVASLLWGIPQLRVTTSAESEATRAESASVR